MSSHLDYMHDLLVKTAWRLSTFHTTAVVPNTEAAAFIHGDAGDGSTSAFLLRGPTALGLVIGFQADDTGSERPLIKFVHVHDVGENQVNLSDPQTGLFWCAGPPNDVGQGVIVCDRAAPNEWETFSVCAVDLGHLLDRCPLATDYLDVLDDATLERVFARRLSRLKYYAIGNADVEIIRHCALALPAGIESLMRELSPDAAGFELARRLAHDRIGRETVDRLEEWLKHRDEVAPPPFVSAEHDACIKVDLTAPDLFTSIVGALRSKVSPRKRACLVASARNEGPYFLEWIAYHLAVGFDHIFIYTNDNDDESDSLLASLASHGVISYISNQVTTSISSQEKAYCHALSILPQILDYEWALFADLDEFFVFDTARYNDVGEFLAARDASCDAVALQWLWFGNGGARGLTEGGRAYTHRFDLRHADVHPAIKTMCRPRYFHYSHPHYPFAIRGKTPVFQDCEGNPHKPHRDEFAFSIQPGADSAGINHYVYKSIEDCLWKFRRNPGDRPLATGRGAVEIANDIGGRLETFDMRREMVVDDRITACAPGLADAMRELRGLSGVDEAATRVDELMHGRVGELRTELLALNLEEQSEFTQIVIKLLRGEELYSRP